MARHPEQQYLDIMARLLADGNRRMDRTGEGTLSLFGQQMRFDLSDGTIPVFTTKKVFWKTAVKEMLWFLTGQTNIEGLLRENVKIWTDWPLAKYRTATGDQISQDDFENRILEDRVFALQWGDLGPVYGKQWRRWEDADGHEHDQIATVISTLKNNPSSRRILFHGWNVAELDRMALPPCHMTYQFHVSNGKLSGMLFQRSCDLGLGFAFNVFATAMLIRMVADQCGYEPGELVWNGGDVHLYLNHAHLVEEQLARVPQGNPKLRLLRKPDSIFDYRIEDFEVQDYAPQAHIAAPVAV